jgi:hypothetical protein
MNAIHWGHKVILVFLLFAAGMLTLVIKSMHAKIDMVTNDYYGAELQYQQVINGRQNAEKLSAPVNITQSGNEVTITFPPELHGQALQGQVLFYRPSDAHKDVSMPLQADAQGRQLVSKQRLTPGSYRVKIEWAVNKVPYFQESALYIH